MRNTRSTFLTTPSSQTNIQSKVTRLYTNSLGNIEKNFALNPEEIYSKRINRWLNHQFDVRLLDQKALSWYLLGTTAHLCSGVFIHRNNREPIPNNLYCFLVCGSAFGKSVFYRRFFEAISDCPVYNESGTGEIPPSTKDSTMNATEAFHFLDEMSRGGLLKQLNQNDKIVLLDEADGCLKRNGLIPDGPISEHNNIYEIVLTLYSGQATVTKSLTYSTSNLHLKKLTILANTTEEPIIRLLKKKLSGDPPNPFAERSLFLFITTPLTLEKPFPPLWNFNNEPTINQIAFTASQLNNLDFYYETDARLMTIAHGNLMCKLMIKNEKIDKWFTARLGKSREHLHRLAVNLQLIQLTFDLIDKYKSDFGDLNRGLNDLIFQQRMKSVVNNFLGRTDDQTRIKLEVRLSIANAAVKLLHLLLHQYIAIFGDDNICLSTTGSETSESILNNLDEMIAPTVTSITPVTTNENAQTAPHEKSIKDLVKDIMLCNETMFTKTDLSHNVNSWKKNSSCHDAAIELLLNKKLIIQCEKAIKNNGARRWVTGWIKSIPTSHDLADLSQFQETLGEFNISWDAYQRALKKFQPPTDVIINDDLANLLRSQKYQVYVQFDVDTLTMVSNNVTTSATNEEQNDNVLNDNTLNTSIGSTCNGSTSFIGGSESIVQQSPQSDSVTTPVRTAISISSNTSVSTEIPVQQYSVVNQVSPSSTGTVTQFRLPRPVELAATRPKQTAVNRARAAGKKQM